MDNNENLSSSEEQESGLAGNRGDGTTDPPPNPGGVKPVEPEDMPKSEED